jgi:predicted acyltransferase
MVLANMALFGVLIYYFTYNNSLLRIGILPFIMAIFLAAKEPGNGFAKSIFNFNELAGYKFDWLYKFYFLKYLFIIIPGTIAGDILVKNTTEKVQKISTKNNLLTTILLFVIVFNVYALFTRQLYLNVIITATAALTSIKYLAKNSKNSTQTRFLKIGFYLLLLGLFFEAYEGGIKKDSSTYSYYFVTSGLAFLSLVVFDSLTSFSFTKSIIHFFATNGKNPMVAYVTGSLVLLPILSLTNTKTLYDAMNTNVFIGFLKGVLFTGFVSLITIFFVKQKWFWKT